MRRAAGPACLVLLALLLGGCAWSNRANRPTWNAFEEHLVPESDGAFYAALPLTVPAGLLAILADTFVVHPIQVADDAWDDAGDVWEHVPWETQYYTQMALLPFRVVATPLVLVLSFVGRSCFDIPPYDSGKKMFHFDNGAGDDEARERREAYEAANAEADAIEKAERKARAEAQAQARAEAFLLRAFDRVANRAPIVADVALSPRDVVGTDALQTAFEAALARGSAGGRLSVLVLARTLDLPPLRADEALGLRDPDPVVRYEMLRMLPNGALVPRDLREALKHDSVELVQEMARAKWP